ncbi:MAG: hypothetical protein N2593_01460 [Patescibacteria group bacterium]|nr:hypothetical protein [Patescibacteria group bacterium]
MKKNPFLIIFILIVLSFFIINFGLNIIINSSIFIANFFQKRKSPEIIKKNNNQYLSVDIDNIPVATNSSKIIIEMSAINIDEIDVYLNDQKIKQIKDFLSQNFSEEINDLKEGENKIYLVGKNKSENMTKKTQVYKVLYKPTKPKLEISEPKDGEIINKNEISIKGETDKEVYIKINNLPVIVDALGKFQYQARLNEGENNFEIEAIDIAGNIEKKSIKIIYQKD